MAVLPSGGSLTKETAVTCMRDSSTGEGIGIQYLQVTSNEVSFQTRISPSILLSRLQCSDLTIINDWNFLALVIDPTSAAKTYKVLNFIFPLTETFTGYYGYATGSLNIYVYDL